MKETLSLKQDKTYFFKKDLYITDVIVPTILCIFLSLISLYKILLSGSLASIWSLILCVSIYTVFNNVVSFSNPSKVRLNEKKIEFESFNVTHKYEIENIKSLKIREFPSAGLIYLRVDNTLLKGRYWIKTKKFDQGKQLFRDLIDLEYILNPESLKSYARNTSEKYSKYKKVKR